MPADAGEVGVAADEAQDAAGHAARLLVVLEVAAGLEDRAVRVDHEFAENLLRHDFLTERHFYLFLFFGLQRTFCFDKQ